MLLYQLEEPPASFEIITLVFSLGAADRPETSLAHSLALLGLDEHYCRL